MSMYDRAIDITFYVLSGACFVAVLMWFLSLFSLS